MSLDELLVALEMDPQARLERIAALLDELGDLEAVVSALREVRILAMAVLAAAKVVDAAEAIVEGTEGT